MPIIPTITPIGTINSIYSPKSFPKLIFNCHFVRIPIPTPRKSVRSMMIYT